MDKWDPNEWTKSFVSSNRAECLETLQYINSSAVIESIYSKDYPLAISGLDRIMNGLVTMHNAKCGNFKSILAMFSLCGGVLVAFCLEANESRRRETALKYCKDARDFARNAKTKQRISAIISDLESGVSLARLKEEAGGDFALSQTVLEILTDMNNRLSSVSPQVSPLPLRPANQDFDTWADQLGWGEEELEYAYKRVRFRRNLYGLCLLFAPLGVLICPFWFRAVYLTKALRCRSFAVNVSFLTNAVMLLYALPTFFIYPLIMLKIIVATNWGMGLNPRWGWGRRVLVLVLAVLAVSIIMPVNHLPIPSDGELAAVPGRIFSALGLPGSSKDTPSSSGTSAGDLERETDLREEKPEAEQIYRSEGFVFPDSDTVLIEQSEIENLPDADLTYAINEIYARHGYIFRSDDLREYYEQFSWYSGEIPANEFSAGCFNQIEQQNWNLLTNERTRRKASG